jgi:predicted double-glycine peptidase
MGIIQFLKLSKYFPIFILLNQIILSFLIYNRNYSYPNEYIIENFPVLKQPDQITCGPTSATMVLNYYGKTTTIEQAKIDGKTEWFKWNQKPIGMTSPDYVSMILDKNGVSSKIRYGNLGKIKYYISKNKPPILLLRTGYQYWHYVVAVGYNEKGVYLADPGYGEIKFIENRNLLLSWNFKGDMKGNEFKDGIDWFKLSLNLAEVKNNLMIVTK